MKAGIQTRLLFTTSLVLGTCLFVGGWVLDRSFQASVIAGAQEQLRLVTYSLMGAVELESGRVVLREEPPEPRLSQPESGLYAAVSPGADDGRWQSISALTSDVGFPGEVLASAPGEFRFSQRDDARPGTVLWYSSSSAPNDAHAKAAIANVTRRVRPVLTAPATSHANTAYSIP